MDYALVERIGNSDLFNGKKQEAVGFKGEAEDYCKERGIAWSEDERWQEI